MNRLFSLRKQIVKLIGIPLITFSLFVFESSDPRFFLFELMWSFIISLILWYGNGLIISLLNKYIPWRQPAWPRILIQIGISVIFTIWLTYFAVKYLYSGLYEAHFSSLVFRKNLFIFLIISLLYNAVYTGIHFFKQWRTSLIETEELKRQNLIAQYESLKNQISPHFLFNSINTMIGLIDEDPELAKKFGHQFAQIYRKILAHSKEELISVKDELEIVQIQNDLFKSRFGDGLQINFKVPEHYLKRKIPTLSLQMLIDNAIKHNQISIKNPLKIQVEVTNNHISVSNNIQVKNFNTASTGTGLENIKKRYSYMSDSIVEIANEDNQFIVNIPLLNNESSNR